MSSHKVILQVSKRLRSLLWEALEGDAEIGLSSDEDIVFKNPTETARDSANRLSVWLYQIAENEFVKNQPMVRSNAPEADRFPPLALNLYYLVTPFGPTAEADQLLLGRVMQVLYDNAALFLESEDDDVVEEVRIIFVRLTLEELTRIWEALREPYRLSVCYQVRVGHIGSRRLSEQERVVERKAGLQDKPRTRKE